MNWVRYDMRLCLLFVILAPQNFAFSNVLALLLFLQLQHCAFFFFGHFKSTFTIYLTVFGKKFQIVKCIFRPHYKSSLVGDYTYCNIAGCFKNTPKGRNKWFK